MELTQHLVNDGVKEFAELLRELLKDDQNRDLLTIPWSEEYGFCLWCNVRFSAKPIAPDDPKGNALHKEDCPYIRALKLLAEYDQIQKEHNEWWSKHLQSKSKEE